MSDYSSVGESGAAALIGAMGIGFYLVMFVLGILCIVAWWKIFEKAGEDGWKSLIPFYNTYILFKISCGNGWLFLILFIFSPFIYWQEWKLCKAFDKGIGFFVLMLFLPPVAYLMLGFGDADYIGVQ